MPSEWHLTADDWRLLTEIKDILEPVYYQTKRCEGWGSEGHHGSLWEILGSMEYLLSHFEKVKEEYSAATDSLMRAREVLASIPPRRRNRPPAYQPDHLPVHIRRDYTISGLTARQYTAEDLINDHRIYLAISINLA